MNLGVGFTWFCPALKDNETLRLHAYAIFCDFQGYFIILQMKKNDILLIQSVF